MDIRRTLLILMNIAVGFYLGRNFDLVPNLIFLLIFLGGQFFISYLLKRRNNNKNQTN
jgi:hypothetical protein